MAFFRLGGTVPSAPNWRSAGTRRRKRASPRAGRSRPGAAEAEDHADEDGKGREEPDRGDGAGAGQGDGGQ